MGDQYSQNHYEEKIQKQILNYAKKDCHGGWFSNTKYVQWAKSQGIRETTISVAIQFLVRFRFLLSPLEAGPKEMTNGHLIKIMGGTEKRYILDPDWSRNGTITWQQLLDLACHAKDLYDHHTDSIKGLSSVEVVTETDREILVKIKKINR